LLQHLRNQSAENVVIVGMMTNMCVDSTTRVAKDFGFNCTVISDAFATTNLKIGNIEIDAKKCPQFFSGNIRIFYAKILTADEFMKQ